MILGNQYVMPAKMPKSAPLTIMGMKMRDEKKTIVQFKVRAGNGDQNARHAAQREQADESHEIHHGRTEPDPSVEHREDPIEDLHAVGIAMILVMMPKNASTSAPAPIVKKW